MVAPPTFLRSILTWPVSSQQRSRRNALLASTALTQLRHERNEVEEFLDLVNLRWSGVRRERLPAADVI